MLSRVKLSNEQIVEAICNCNTELLNQEWLHILAQCVPTPEEDAEIANFEHKEALDLGKEEKFQIEVGKVVRVRERIDLLMCAPRRRHCRPWPTAARVPRPWES